MPPKKPNFLLLPMHLIFVGVFILIGDHLFRLWAFQARLREIPGEVPYIVAASSALVYLTLVLVVRRMTAVRRPGAKMQTNGLVGELKAPPGVK